MIETIRQLAGILGAATLIALPGNWIAFGLPVAALGFWPRFACGVLLSPAVVFVQFSLLRWANVPFSAIAVILPILNAPALWLVLRSSGRFAIPDRKTTWSWAIALVAPAAFLAMWMHNTDVRANWGHSWLHTDLAYSIANGSVRPEEPLLAGVRLAYPWLADLYQGLISYLLNVSPNSSYVWIDVVWLACTIGLVAHLVGQLGGKLWARTSSVIFLCFGVNAVGYIGGRILPEWFTKQYPFWGDGRYTPWIRKYGVFAGTALGIALLGAIAVLVTRDWNGRSKSRWALVASLLIALALSYPILFPAAALLVGARIMMALFYRLRGLPSNFSEIAGPLTGLALGGLTTFIWLRVITVDKISDPILWRPLWSVKVQIATAFVVMSPLLLGVALSGYGLLKRHTEAVVILLTAAAGCTVATALFDIQYPTIEYKFIFPAALYLTPFAAIAWSNMAGRIRSFAWPLFAALTLFLVGPAFHDLSISWPYLWHGGRPHVDVSDFAFRLKSQEPYAAFGTAIRQGSPTNSVLVAPTLAKGFNLDPVTLTQRQMYVPYEGDKDMFGIEVWSDDLLKLTLGYNPALVDRRRTTVHQLFTTSLDSIRIKQLATIWSELHRPLVVVADAERHSEFAAWLTNRSGFSLLYEGDGVKAWLVPSYSETETGIPAAVSALSPRSVNRLSSAGLPFPDKN